MHIDIKLPITDFKNEDLPSREYKGKSIISLTDDYTVIDIETTDLSPEYGEIIEIAAIKYRNGVIVDSFSSLIALPEYYGDLDSFISQLTGITNEMLSSAPTIEDVLPSFKSFIGDDILIGHNVAFDINFLYDAFIRVLEEPLTNDFVNTIRITRKLYPELGNYKLVNLAREFKISATTGHRALADCETTNALYSYLKDIVFQRFNNVEDFYKLFKKKKSLIVKDLSPECTEFDETHPLYKKTCVFTGTLEKMSRKDAMQYVVNLGGLVGENVTQKTNYLILGNNDYCKTIKGGKSNKHKKAEALKLAGNDIEVISENLFYSLLSE